MKIALVTNQASTYKPDMAIMVDILKEYGHEPIWVANFNNYHGAMSTLPLKAIHYDVTSNPLLGTNLRAYKQLKDILLAENICGISTSTPIGSLLAHLAANRLDIVPVLYTAHGFLFYEGAPLINQTLYRAEETYCIRNSDALVTINDEDYKAAQRIALRGNGKVYRIHGAGIAVDTLPSKNIATLKSTLGIKENETVFISAARLDKNKNLDTALRAFANSKDRNWKYIIAGDGPERESLIQLCERLAIDDKVQFLGYRTDIPELLDLSDVFVLSSIREGLSRSLMEAMSHGLPAIASNARGNAELLGSGKGGIICDSRDVCSYERAIRWFLENIDSVQDFSDNNLKVLKNYSSERVAGEWKIILKEVFGSESC